MLRNTLWDLPYGDNLQGIFGACPPELLHQYGLGIEKRCFQHTWDAIRDSAKERKVGFDRMKRQFDARFADFQTRHVDSEMPRFHFASGTYELSYMTSSEYTALIFQVPIPSFTPISLDLP